MVSNGIGRDVFFLWIVVVNCKLIKFNVMLVFLKVIRLKNKMMKMILFSVEFVIQLNFYFLLKYKSFKKKRVNFL